MGLPGYIWSVGHARWREDPILTTLGLAIIGNYWWPITKQLARGAATTGWAWGGEVYASGAAGHFGRGVWALARTTPGQIFVGAVGGYAIGLGVGYGISRHMYGKEGGDVFLDVWTPGGEHGILRKKTPATIREALIIQAGARQQQLEARREEKYWGLGSTVKEQLIAAALGPIWGPWWAFTGGKSWRAYV